jgi:hypothetical protein
MVLKILTDLFPGSFTKNQMPIPAAALMLWLQLRGLEYPPPMLVFTFIVVSYFVVTAGIAYDIINEPPAVGGVQDPVTGGSSINATRSCRAQGSLSAHYLSHLHCRQSQASGIHAIPHQWPVHHGGPCRRGILYFWRWV